MSEQDDPLAEMAFLLACPLSFTMQEIDEEPKVFSSGHLSGHDYRSLLAAVEKYGAQQRVQGGFSVWDRMIAWVSDEHIATAATLREQLEKEARGDEGDD